MIIILVVLWLILVVQAQKYDRIQKVVKYSIKMMTFVCFTAVLRLVARVRQELF